ncbi:hypothetical protein GGR53DRAFT_462975 [Hypoxylon sp. FL1150]|nr:hypothetical protein GGR53DRAFT_462975 [Hypoxylon sp. FL1150]
MNETDVAAFEPVPTLVKPPSTHGLPRTGVMSIEQTSCKARKRPRVPFHSSTSYSPSHSSSSSRVAKSNKFRGSGGSAPSSSSLAARVAESKRPRTAADAAAVTSILAAATATADDLGVFGHQTQTQTQTQIPRHQASETRWDHLSFLPGPPSHGQESDTNTGPRDHFTLSSSTLSQSQGPDLYYYPCSEPVVDLNSLAFPPTFHTPEFFLTSPATHENLPSFPNYPTDYPAYTTHPFSSYPFSYSLYTPLDPVSAPTMVTKPYVTSTGGQLPHESDPSCSVKRESSNGAERIEDEWQDIPGNAVPRDEVVPVENLSLGSYEAAPQDADHPRRDSETFLGGPYDYVVPQIRFDVPTDDNRRPSPAEKRVGRSCLDEKARLMTAQTRRLKACIRCRMQKVKCDPDPVDEGRECLTCLKVDLGSRKVIHRLPCLRWKLAEVVLFREGGLELTRRWSGVKVKDLGPRDWVSDQIHTIRVTIGYRGSPLELSVRKFKPNQTDVTWKNWVDKTGAKRRFDIEPYALASTYSTSKEYETYVFQYAWPAVREYSDDPRVHPAVRETYKATATYVLRLENNPPEIQDQDVKPVEFLRQYIQLWFAIRNTLGSAFIVGEDKLGMKPIDDPECPYYNTISIPRMIPAQFDSIGYERILAPKRKQMLEGLWKMMANKNPDHFFAVYLTVFMLVHEVSVTSADRMRRARENKYQEYRYDLASFVERLQEGANIILSHWHYYKRPFIQWLVANRTADTTNGKVNATDGKVNATNGKVDGADKKEAKKIEVWEKLEPDEENLIRRTYKTCLAREAETRRLGPMTWEDDLYFVSQMFEDTWHPRTTFSR